MTPQHFPDYNSDRVPWPCAVSGRTVPSYFLPPFNCVRTPPQVGKTGDGDPLWMYNYVSGVLQEVIWYSNVPCRNYYQYIPFIYVREVAGSRSRERRGFNFVVRWPDVTIKGKGHGLRTCKKCHLSILIYYLNTIRIHKFLIFFLLLLYGASVHFQAMASPISCLHHTSSLLPLYTCREKY